MTDVPFTSHPLTTDLAEAATLGSMLLDPTALTGALDRLDPDDFHRQAHRTVFETIRHLADQGDPVDAITVTVRLIDADQLDHVGGPAALTDLTSPEATPSPAAWAHYAEVVRREGRRRRGIRLLQRAIDRLEAGEDPALIAVELGVAA